MFIAATNLERRAQSMIGRTIRIVYAVEPKIVLVPSWLSKLEWAGRDSVLEKLRMPGDGARRF